MDVKVAKALVVSSVLVADGMMQDDERTFLDGLIRQLGLDAGQRQTVIELEGIDQASAVVRGLPLEERRELLSIVVDASGADGKLSATELDVIKRLRSALGL